MKKLSYEQLSEKLSQTESALRIEKQQNAVLAKKLSRKSAKCVKYQKQHLELKKTKKVHSGNPLFNSGSIECHLYPEGPCGFIG